MKIAILSFTALFFAACGGGGQQAVNINIKNTAQNQPQVAGNSAVVSSHSTDSKTLPTNNATVVPKSETKGKWTQSGDPVDTASFDAEIKQGEDKMKANPKDEALKKSLSEAYSKRGLVLTDARQYASALGDFRKALKLDPANEEAKKWIDQIINIYNSINKEYPKEGEEPPPLPFKKS